MSHSRRFHGPSPAMEDLRAQVNGSRQGLPDVQLGFDVVIGAYMTDEGLLPGIVLELVHLPAGGRAATACVRTSAYVMTRAHAERIRNMLTKVLNQPKVKTLN